MLTSASSWTSFEAWRGLISIRTSKDLQLRHHWTHHSILFCQIVHCLRFRPSNHCLCGCAPSRPALCASPQLSEKQGPLALKAAYSSQWYSPGTIVVVVQAPRSYWCRVLSSPSWCRGIAFFFWSLDPGSGPSASWWYCWRRHRQECLRITPKLGRNSRQWVEYYQWLSAARMSRQSARRWVHWLRRDSRMPGKQSLSEFASKCIWRWFVGRSFCAIGTRSGPSALGWARDRIVTSNHAIWPFFEVVFHGASPQIVLHLWQISRPSCAYNP